MAKQGRDVGRCPTCGHLKFGADFGQHSLRQGGVCDGLREKKLTEQQADEMLAKIAGQQPSTMGKQWIARA